MANNIEKINRRSKYIGVLFTVAFHVCALFVFTTSGLKYIYPPPEEVGILLDFTEMEEPKPIEVQAGNEPKAVNANPENDIKLVQKSEAQEVGEKPAESVESHIGEDGDVEKPAPAEHKKVEIDKRALFSSVNNKKKDTLAAQTADRVSDALKSGDPQGNTRYGDTDGAPSAKLQGRNVVGSLPFPAYTVNNEGKVVVKILVDQYGKVTNAIPGVNGTTVQDKRLWEAAKEAAYKAIFNVSSSAPTVQEGTITYVFKLK